MNLSVVVEVEELSEREVTHTMLTVLAKKKKKSVQFKPF